MKKVLITGCSRGLGNSLFKELLKREYVVIPHFRNKQIEAYPNEIIGDINNIDTIDLIGKSIIENDIDIIINNAAVYYTKPLLECSDNEIKEMINIDLISQILIIKRAYNYFKEKNKGIIININSLAGKNPSSNESIYCAVKMGLDGFSKSLQLESLGMNIRFIDFYIGAMKTDMSMWRNNYNDLIDPKEIAFFISNCIEKYKSFNINEYIIRRTFN